MTRDCDKNGTYYGLVDTNAFSGSSGEPSLFDGVKVMCHDGWLNIQKRDRNAQEFDMNQVTPFPIGTLTQSKLGYSVN